MTHPTSPPRSTIPTSRSSTSVTPCRGTCRKIRLPRSTAALTGTAFRSACRSSAAASTTLACSEGRRLSRPCVARKGRGRRRPRNNQFRHSGMRHLAQARNPYSRSWLWIPGSRFARPGMTMRGCGMTVLHIPQGREQRQAEQRDHADDEPKREGPEPAATGLLDHDRLRPRCCAERVSALDHAARDMIGDAIADNSDVVAFRDHDAAETGVLHEAVDALVASHHNMSNDVDPQPRRIALAAAAIKQIDLLRNLRKQRVERVVQNLKPGHFGVTQVDDDADAIGGLDPRLPQGIGQTKAGGIAEGIAPG